MRRYLLAALAAALALLLAGPASAQEESHHRPGLYVAAVAGYNSQVLEVSGIDLADGKLIAGGLAGFQWRWGQGVIGGIEADFLLMDVSASSSPGGITVTASSQYLASVRALVGIPLGPVLFYATGGPAYTSQKLSVAGGGSSTDALWGVVAGGGIKAELTRTMFARLEALHYVFPDQDVAGPTPASFLEAENQQTVVRGVLGFTLN